MTAGLTAPRVAATEPPRPGPGSTQPSRWRRLGYERRRAAAWMLAPALLHLTIWIGIPTVATFVLAFTNYDVLAGTISWAGLGNFREIFSDPTWNLSIWHTVVYTFFTVPVAMVIAVVIAVLLNNNLRGRSPSLPAPPPPRSEPAFSTYVLRAYDFLPSIFHPIPYTF